MRKIVSRNPLFFAFFFPAVTDSILTILGQDPQYWTGGVVNEASPAYYALVISPWLFVIGSVFWFILWYWIFKKLKEPINLFFMFLFIAGHSWGSSSWIWKIAKDINLYVKSNQISIMLIWLFVIFYFVIVGLFASYALSIYIRDRK